MSFKISRPNPVSFIAYRTTDPKFEETTRFPVIALWRDNWDDYGHKTLFSATYYRSADESFLIGNVKIAEGDKAFRPEVPSSFKALPEGAYSLGQSISYYRSVKRHLKLQEMRHFLRAMGDCVAFKRLSDQYESTTIWEKSFLRSSSAKHALERGGFYVGGRAVKTVEPPSFRLQMRISGALKRHVIAFDFHQSAEDMPHRVCLLVGRNGTGKTTALATAAYRLSGVEAAFQTGSLGSVAKTSALLSLNGETEDDFSVKVSQIIAVSYNAFDEFPLPEKPKRSSPSAFRSRLNYKYCGLRNMDGELDTDQILKMWTRSLEPIAYNDRNDVLQDVLKNFLPEEVVEELMKDDDEDRKKFFKKLSAGQRLIVSIFADIIAFIEEGSILLIDEPETHLHPGLLSSFYVSLVEILDEFDSYAIISTHSPVVLQNVPSRNVNVIKRVNNVPSVKPLRIESLGEDYGELYREVFGLADVERDFTDILQQLYETHGSAEAVRNLFKKPLGLPAEAYLMSLEVDGE